MAAVRSRVVGGERLRRKLEGLPDLLRLPIRKAVEAGAIMVERDAKLAVKRGPKTGEVYEKYRPRREHRASAPGEAPASDTGRLAQNITHEIASDGMVARVVSRGSYASHLEFGTTKMAARPYLFPALEANRKKIRERMRREINTALRKATRGRRR